MAIIKTSAERTAELEAQIAEIEDKASAEAIEAKEDEVLSPEEKTFKKRYSDLRSHSARLENQFRQEIDQLKAQLQSATKKEINFPKTEEEVKEWASKYPDVYETIVTIARQNAIDVAKDVQESVSALQVREHEQAKREAYSQLLNAHEDFPDIATSQEFIDWIEAQPKYIYDALYVNETDAGSAIRAVDLYKSDVGLTKKKAEPKKADTRIDDARQVSKSKPSNPNDGNSPKWTESKLSTANWNRLSDADLAEIEIARQDPAFYDLSGGAR